jgi:hypothetical protein
MATLRSFALACWRSRPSPTGWHSDDGQLSGDELDPGLRVCLTPETVIRRSTGSE